MNEVLLILITLRKQRVISTILRCQRVENVIVILCRLKFKFMLIYVDKLYLERGLVVRNYASYPST